MAKTFICLNCHLEKDANSHLREQSYCGMHECQKARKRIWQKQKMASDPDYRETQSNNLKDWRKNKPLHEYQRTYRFENPKYVKANRKKQKARNRKRQKQNKSASRNVIVKMDALTYGKSDAYVALPCRFHGETLIVKMDTPTPRKSSDYAAVFQAENIMAMIVKMAR